VFGFVAIDHLLEHLLTRYKLPWVITEALSFVETL